MPSATVHIGKDHYQTHIKVRDHELRADEPKERGGKDAGPSSSELLLAGLGACKVITVRMYADRKEWPLEEMHVSLELERTTESGKMHTSITSQVELVGPLDEEQRERLLDISERCPVHKTLISPVTITSKLKN